MSLFTIEISHFPVSRLSQLVISLPEEKCLSFHKECTTYSSSTICRYIRTFWDDPCLRWYPLKQNMSLSVAFASKMNNYGRQTDGWMDGWNMPGCFPGWIHGSVDLRMDRQMNTHQWKVDASQWLWYPDLTAIPTQLNLSIHPFTARIIRTRSYRDLGPPYLYWPKNVSIKLNGCVPRREQSLLQRCCLVYPPFLLLVHMH